MGFGISTDKETIYRNGYFVEYKNGFGVSVQFGRGNYCDSYNGIVENNTTAECAVLLEGELCQIDDTWTDTVKGHMTPEEVTALMFQVMNLKA